MEEITHEQETHTPQEPAKAPKAQALNSFAIPISIVIGFGMIAVAIYFSGVATKTPTPNVVGGTPTQQQEATVTGPVKPVTEDDHIRGNPNAPIMIVEFSDYDCPFCKNFHETMTKIMDNYGTDGKVAWVYRHFPLEQLHPSAPRIAEASECVAKLGGDEAFWKFSDLIFGERGVNEPTNMTRLTEFAISSGVSGTAFDACLEEGKMKEFVEADFADGISAGAKGTPYTLVLVGGQQGVISGARPYEYVSSIIDTLLAQMEGKDAQPAQ